MIALLTHFKIGPRLATSFAALLLGTLALSLYALFSLSQLASELRAIRDTRLPTVDRLVQVADTINVIARQTRNILIFDNVTMQAGWITSIQKARTDSQRLLVELQPHLQSDEDKALLSEAETLSKAFDADAQSFLGHIGNGEMSEATELLEKKLRDSQLAFNKKIDQIKASEIKRVGLTADAADALYRESRLLIASALLALILLGASLSWGITRSIVTPLGRALREAGRIAEGDLSAELTVQGRDEAAAMLQALVTMQRGLRAIVHEVRQGVGSVATASHQIAQGNLDLSARTEEQASSLQQTAASVQQISTNVKTNAQSAAQANALADTASGSATRGGQLVSLAVSRIGELEGSSQRIAEIVGVIEGIAFQTNILALNAAVEAARAGEQGRGFAVVASEVRALAQRSGEAAKEIKSLVTRSVEQIQHSSATARDAGTAMHDIVEQVQRVCSLIAGIHSASQQQDQGVSEVHQAMGELDEMTQRNAALVEESTAAAESLRQQAQRLSEVVASFRLEPVAAQR
jgi:methyl-accepting chemotaxis protein